MKKFGSRDFAGAGQGPDALRTVQQISLLHSPANTFHLIACLRHGYQSLPFETRVAFFALFRWPLDRIGDLQLRLEAFKISSLSTLHQISLFSEDAWSSSSHYLQSLHSLFGVDQQITLSHLLLCYINWRTRQDFHGFQHLSRILLSGLPSRSSPLHALDGRSHAGTDQDKSALDE